MKHMYNETYSCELSTGETAEGFVYCSKTHPVRNHSKSEPTMLSQEEYVMQIWVTRDQETNACQYQHDHAIGLAVMGCDENFRTEGIAMEGDA